MSYFSKIPNILITQQNKAYALKDLAIRITPSTKYTENNTILDDYFVTDGETPEMISNAIYDSPFYHWVILLTNNIVDPREEWPISNSKIMDRVYLNYDFQITVPSGAAYSVNDILTSSTYNDKFIVTSKSGNVIEVRSQNGFVPLTTSNTFTNETTDVSGLTLTTVVLPPNRIHHYYDTELEVIVDYDAGNINLVSVTNLEHENDINDKKRTIKVLKPELLPSFLKTFNSRLSG